MTLTDMKQRKVYVYRSKTEMKNNSDAINKATETLLKFSKISTQIATFVVKSFI